MTARSPYDAHLCAQDPAKFEAGFLSGQAWARSYDRTSDATAMYEAIRDSTNVPFPETADKAAMPPTPFGEGFMLAVYGHHRLALEQAAP